MKRARLIYNPSAGREEVRKRIPDILNTLEEAGYETSCHATKGEGDATLAARRAVENRFDLVIAAGGDGTVYEVINGIAEQRYRPALGIIPAGTTNDFARAIGLPRSIPKAVGVIAKGKPSPIDIGKINDKYFINIAGGGSLTTLTYEVPSKVKTMLGQLAYYIKGIEKLPFLSPMRVRIEADNNIVIDEEIMLFLIANSNSVGGFEKLMPKAKLDDGLFDCIVLKKTSLPEFIRIATMALKGEHFKHPNVIHFQTKQLKATANKRVDLNLDGELGSSLPCKFTALPRHIQLIR
ncbi:diacylglycerol kinase [Aneurinibacillus thermoaerophilus]|uniref:Diacylglycerol kinase n=1 Tax=Aneurinibacillus thermoaerophilus TaxID=143495 RepID=A0ABX8YD47_ANETH|nr:MULTISPECIES: diacylglycerol kinase [Aneurinibacillus]AMA74190.1 lipid kinase [Aneurinibacillus sp. XH2]MED0679103.1 diacylglycerol kinase [Aneurinibacillus thermoaerophilus]MED0757882.1 diacylglycerol kinase [Aneurinibacillus thermoaerophilus]MED0762569.1 diacylglycerol kinase [Aneurinibacillus thermoaerophilus]MED0763044.1 diacylglycerol kinase [Aneurinibacillus thermoaerophilus]